MLTRRKEKRKEKTDNKGGRKEKEEFQLRGMEDKKKNPTIKVEERKRGPTTKEEGEKKVTFKISV